MCDDDICAVNLPGGTGAAAIDGERVVHALVVLPDSGYIIADGSAGVE
jgi:hypothetical protein